MSQVLNVSSANFDSEVLKSPVSVLVDFYADWCGPCQNMSPILDNLASELSGKFKIVKIDTQHPDNMELVMKYQIQSIPNMKIFRGGQVVKEIIGFHTQEELQSEISAFI